MLNELGNTIFKDRYALSPDETFEQATRRVASIGKTPAERLKFENLILSKQLIPAGRIWRSIGTTNLTGYNCYVLPSPHDSRSGVVDTLRDMIEIMSHGGGVGINLATLRPTGSVVRGVSGKSSGPVSWGEIYSFATGLIEQGGSRRGALMLTLPIWHPSIVEFVTAKTEMHRILNANVSVLVSDEFMMALDNDDMWELRFPDTSDPLYDSTWDGDLDTYMGSVLSYGTIRARELWQLIAESAWRSAEPGIIFWDTVTEFFAGRWDGSKPVCVNPCGEQPLPAYGVCNLSHLNLSEYVENGEFLWNVFAEDVGHGVVFLNRVIDNTNAVLPEVETRQNSERRIGLGVLGLHDALIKMNMVYGSERSRTFVADVFGLMYVSAVRASALLAREEGSYAIFNKDEFLHSTEYEWVRAVDKNVASLVEDYGLRNASLLTVAPTGTVGTMLDVSTGIEPHFAFEYKRNSRLGEFTVRPAIAEGRDLSDPVFVTAQELTPTDHLLMLAIAQSYVDSSISKTINLPHSATVQDVLDVYTTAWNLGVKGLTVYRDGSRNEQILSTVEAVVEKKKCEECGGDMVYQEGCATCTNCGVSFCAV